MKIYTLIAILFFPVFAVDAVPVLLPVTGMMASFFLTIFLFILAGAFFVSALVRKNPRRWLVAGVIFLLSGLLYYFYV